MKENKNYNVDNIIKRLKSLSNPEAVKGMAKYGINLEKNLGVSIPPLRQIGKRNFNLNKMAVKIGEEIYSLECKSARWIASDALRELKSEKIRKRLIDKEKKMKGDNMPDQAKEILIAYCGLFCGGCFSYQGKIADLARDLRKELRQTRFDKTAESLSNLSFFKVFKEYTDCYEVLGGMVKLRCKKGCSDGGGDPFCVIRKCCVKKGFEGCWQCDKFGDCRKMDILKTNHGDAHIKNLRIVKKKGKKELLCGKKYWYSKIKG